MGAESIIKQGLPKALRPMLAQLARHPFDSPNHLFELKWEGIRALALIDGGGLRLLSRSSKEITAHFPELLQLPKQVTGQGMILDGELVCLDDRGHPSFARLQQRLRRTGNRVSRSNRVQYVAFDVLYVNGSSVMGEPLFERKNILHQLLAPSEIAQACEFIENDGEAFFQATCELGLEGIVAKDKSSLYFPGKRSRNWWKVKRVRESEFVIGGYTFGGKRREHFSSLLLGLYDRAGQLVFVGQVSAGISKPLAKEVYASLKDVQTTECPFESVPGIQKFLYWCRPELVCQVGYGEFTEEGILAYPVFGALREDKAPEECTITDSQGWPIRLTEFA